MSSAYRLKGGSHEIAFFFTDPKTDQRKRYKLRLGAVTLKQRREVQTRLDELLAARRLGLMPDVDLRVWLKRIDEDLHRQFAEAGLIRSRVSITLETLCNRHLARLREKQVEQSTIRNVSLVVTNLRTFCEDERRIRSFTVSDASEFRRWLAKSGGKNGGELAPSTVSRRCRRAREIFDTAIKKRWLKPGANPFREMDGWDEANPDREEYIPWNDFARIIDLCACPEFRLFLAVTRLCGIRSPSDVLPMVWAQVDWDLGIIRVHSQKNRRYKNKRTRYVPIFNELEPFLQAAWEAAPENSDQIFPALQVSTAALTDRLESLCRKAGIAMWPRPFNNPRASGERDMWRSLPFDEVAAILDHSPQTAHRHYNRFAKDLKARAEGRALQFPDLTWGGGQNLGRYERAPGAPRARLRKDSR